MTVDTMRKIDRYVGVPICFVLSIFSWLFGWLRFSRKKQPDVSRTLFIELSAGLNIVWVLQVFMTKVCTVAG
jgi:hypothetical protein